MRILIDVHGLDFDEAWEHRPSAPSPTPTTRCCPRRWKAGRCRCSSGCCRATCRSSTRSTPRCSSKRASGRFKTSDQIARISLIDEDGERRVRMGNLAFVGSHSINGVSALHTELMKETVFADLHKLYPDRINNKTNGITPRRWLMQCNPGLTDLIREAIGDGFMTTSTCCRARQHSPTTSFQEQFAA
jgi:starch phosphorylase